MGLIVINQTTFEKTRKEYIKLVHIDNIPHVQSAATLAMFLVFIIYEGTVLANKIIKWNNSVCGDKRKYFGGLVYLWADVMDPHGSLFYSLSVIRRNFHKRIV